MNRRHFFGMTLGALAAAGLPEILMPQKTLFLPPTIGWHPHELSSGSMRESLQYLINTDTEMWRYDAIGRDFWGKEAQFYVDIDGPAPEARRIELANRILTDCFRQHGMTALKIGESREFKLALSSRSHGIYTLPYGAQRYI